jgi:hypothetical protein
VNGYDEENDGGLRQEQERQIDEIIESIGLVDCPYCADPILGQVFYDQTCAGCINRMKD